MYHLLVHFFADTTATPDAKPGPDAAPAAVGAQLGLLRHSHAVHDGAGDVLPAAAGALPAGIVVAGKGGPRR